MFKTPKFWHEKTIKSAIISHALLPFSMLFSLGTKIRKLTTNERKIGDKFVICVGNASLGGNGKTPVTLALFEELSHAFPNDICVLSKGSGRKTKGFITVQKTMNALRIGDEPSLISQTAPVYLFTKTKDILQNLSSIKEKIILMDDGLQNPNFHKNFTLLIVGNSLFGNGKIFPAGPLRELPQSAIAKSDAIIFTGKATFSTETKPCYTAKSEFFCKIPPQEISAFSGLGHNDKFKNSLISQGFSVKHFFEFKDHHQYTTAEIEEIIAKSGNLPIVTTEKDWVKLARVHKNKIHTLNIKYIMHDEIITKIVNAINLQK